MTLGVLLWWLVIQLFSLAALPLAWWFFRSLPGRGYALSKALGLLLVSYLLWLGASFHLLPNSSGGILVALAIVAGLSFWFGRKGLQRDSAAGNARPLLSWLRDNRWHVLAVELLLLVVFLGWTAFRAYNPDIAATEKPMEFAFVNGVLRSRFFPAQDPWLSGYAISYYYFGYVMLAVLTRLSGVDPAVGFNLGVALWCALAAIGAFGLVFDLVQLAAGSKGDAKTGGHVTVSSSGRGIRYGLLGALFVVFLGNLEGLVELAYNFSLLPLRWIQWLDIKQLTDAAPTGNLTGGFWWWWHASRVIHDKDLLGNSIEVIDEFPFFSFLLGDMHPHVLGLAFVFLAIGVALNLLLAAARSPLVEPSFDRGAPGSLRQALHRFWCFAADLTGMGTHGLLLCAIVLGALAFLNTWDFPIYVGLVTLAIGTGLALRRGLTWSAVGRAVGVGLALGLLGWLCYLPFYLGFQSQLGGILPNLLFPSRLSQFLVMFGPFLVATIFFLALLSRRTAIHGTAPREPAAGLQGELYDQGADVRKHSSLRRCFLLVLPWTVLVPLAVWAFVGFAIAMLPQGRAVVESMLNNPAVEANLGDRTLTALLGLAIRLRLATPWTFLFLAALLAWVVALIWVRLPLGRRVPAVDSAVGNPLGGDEWWDYERGGAVISQGQLVAPTSSQAVPLSHSANMVPDLFALLMVGLAVLLTLSVEFVYLRDLFGTRMNTVFKFYYQAWVLLALASAFGLSRLAARGTPPVLKWSALVLTTVLVVGGLFYTVAAIPSKADNFQGQPTLDGLAYLRRSNPADIAAISWLRATVPDQAVVLEAAGGSYSPEGAERISMSTGNPTLLGWDFHEMQWRGKAYEKLTEGRPDAITQIYRTGRAEELPGLLDRWGIDFVYIGALERSKYGIGDAVLARFDRSLTRVYDADGVLIYGR